MTEALAIIGLLALPAWLAWLFFKGAIRGYAAKQIANPEPTKRPYILKSGTLPALIEMPNLTDRLFTYKDERQAANARQRLWMRYQDRSGHVTERTVEIYHPENDEVVFAWCCLARAPRTFARRSIQSWQLLPERFEFDPVVAQYWEEEGTRDMSEKLPWRRWLSDQPSHISQRYK
ncbi:MAG TPA: WYL domain-containing protein [Nitrospiraceae bacterium]|nr:WYL domain-containing protein [Nitrospiraceae bacterium]